MKCKSTLYKILVFFVCLIAVSLFLFLFYDSDGSNVFKDADIYKDYRLYIRAAGLATMDVDRALDLCSKNIKMRDECLIEIASIVSEKDFEKGLCICEIINDTIWRSECFFVVAEVLFDKNVSLASEFCDRSGVFMDKCYNHLGFIH